MMLNFPHIFCSCYARNTARRSLAIKPLLKQKVGKVVVVGGGAVGSLFAGRLSTLKELEGRVWLLTRWEEHADIINRVQGLVIRESEAVGKGCMVGNVKAATSVGQIMEHNKPDDENVGVFQPTVSNKTTLLFLSCIQHKDLVLRLHK